MKSPRIKKLYAALAVIGSAAALAGFTYTAPVDDSSVVVDHSGIDLAYDIEWDAAGVGMGCEGCTPGYWKNNLLAWGPTGYGPLMSYNVVFGVDAFSPPITLLQALNQGGGGLNKLGRHSVAAILNSAHPLVNYCAPPSSRLVKDVQNAIANQNFTVARRMDNANNAGCPLPADQSGKN